MPREREQEPRCWTIQSQAERRDRGQTEESWLLFEGIDTFLYDLMRKSKIEKKTKSKSIYGTERYPSSEVLSTIVSKRFEP